MAEGKKVTYVPSYGAEMRGGTANCVVTVSDRPISSPLTANPGVVVVMNEPSLARFEPSTKAGGILIVNTSLVRSLPVRTDIEQYLVPAGELAAEVGIPKGANMVILGVLLELTGVLETVRYPEYLAMTFGKKREDRLLQNLAAIRKGSRWALDKKCSHSVA
jgi:2-oxoglutarate ferredoxin oxidoreductase subunit gamma